MDKLPNQSSTVTAIRQNGLFVRFERIPIKVGIIIAYDLFATIVCDIVVVE